MIYRDDPAYKALKEQAQNLNLEICVLTSELDDIDQQFHAKGIATPQAVRSALKADRSATRLELQKVEIALYKRGEELRVAGQTDLLDELIASLKADGLGHYLAAAMQKIEAKK